MSKDPKEEELVFNIGETINGFKLVEKIDEGGFGQVFKCTRDNTFYAIKFESSNQEGGSAIKLELNVLKHINGWPVFPAMIVGGRKRLYHYLVMELLGDNLKMLKAKSPNPDALSDGTWSRIGIQCLYAMKVLHDKGFVHRDIKPSNFAVGQNTLSEFRSRRVLLFDFGLARRFVKTQWINRSDKPSDKPNSEKKSKETGATTAAATVTKKTKRATTVHGVDGKKQNSGRKNKIAQAKQKDNLMNVTDRLKGTARPAPPPPPPPKPEEKKPETVLKVPRGDKTVDDEKVEVMAFRVARPHTDFRGTHQYASPNAHTQIELGRHDDVWSLMYMMAEMSVELPWTSNDEIPVDELKSQSCIRRLFTDEKNPSRFTSEMCAKLDEIDRMLKDCNYYSHPNYQLVHDFFLSVMQKSGTTWKTPYDWETALLKPDELTKVIDKANRSDRPWERPDEMFKRDEWAELKIPSASPKPSVDRSKKKPIPRNIKAKMKLSKEQVDDDEPVQGTKAVQSAENGKL